MHPMESNHMIPTIIHFKKIFSSFIEKQLTYITVYI